MEKEIKTQIESTQVKDDAAAIAVENGRRNFFKQSIAGAFGAAAAFNIMPSGLKTMAHAAGSDAPELTEEIGRAHV